MPHLSHNPIAERTGKRTKQVDSNRIKIDSYMPAFAWERKINYNIKQKIIYKPMREKTLTITHIERAVISEES